MNATEEMQELKDRVTQMERELAEIKAERSRKRMGNPWARMAGMFADNALYEDWREAMAEYRRQRDAEEEAKES